MAEKLSPFHITILVYMTQSGIIIFTLPRQLAEHFGTNGWLFLVPCFVISSLNIYLISLVYHMGKGRSIFLILEQSHHQSVAVSALYRLGICVVNLRMYDWQKIRAALSNDLFSYDQFNGLQAGHRPAGFIAAYERDLYHLQSYNNVFLGYPVDVSIIVGVYTQLSLGPADPLYFQGRSRYGAGGTGYLYSVPRV